MKFTSTVWANEDGNTGIIVPDHVVEDLGGGKHLKVSLSLNGFTYRSSIARMGDQFLIPVSKARRAEGNLEVDVPYQIDIELDTAPRSVDVPEELVAHFETDAAAKSAWEAMSYSAQLRMVTPALNAKSWRPASGTSRKLSRNYPGCNR